METVLFTQVLYESRAVKVNQNKALPAPFIRALAMGSVEADQCDASDLVQAVTDGFLMPAEGLVSTLVRYHDYSGTYVIANHLQSSYYHEDLKKRGIFFEKPFDSAADVLLEIIPSIRLHDLVGSCYRPESQPFSSSYHNKGHIPIPHENSWNDCFARLFKYADNRHYSTKKGLGQPDLACLLLLQEQGDGCEIIIESVMSKGGRVQEHVDRFLAEGEDSMELYQSTEGFKTLRGLLVIGNQVTQVKRIMKKVQLKESNKDLQIMGLCPMSGYKSMKFIVSTSAQHNFHEYTIQCNLVPQRLRNNQLVVGHTFGKYVACHKDDLFFCFTSNT